RLRDPFLSRPAGATDSSADRARRSRDPRSRRNGPAAGAAGNRERGRLARLPRHGLAARAGGGAGCNRAAAGGEGVRLSLTVNGEHVDVEARPDDMLIDVLRRLGLASVRETCGIGVCGACTVLVDNDLVSGCLLLAPLADGREVT